MHLLTLRSLKDINLVRDACATRFKQYVFRVQADLDLDSHRLSAEAIGIKRLKIAAAELPLYAQAFYDGLQIGRSTPKE